MSLKSCSCLAADPLFTGVPQLALSWSRLFSVPTPLAATSPAEQVAEGRIMQHVRALADIPGGRGVRTWLAPVTRCNCSQAEPVSTCCGQ